jgi:thioredoxin reductase
MHLEGRLDCTSCHQAHSGAVLSFDETGAVLERGTERELLSQAHDAYRPARLSTLPLVEQATCARCHQLGNPEDPASVCFASALAPYQGCFDEHRSVAEVPSDRDALWTASLEVLRAQLPAPKRPLAPWGILAGALVAAGLVLTGVHRMRRATDSVAPSAPQAAQRARLPQVNANTCLGCSACVDVCPFDVLEVRQFVAVVARPDACCGLSLCEQRCPNGSLVVREGAAIDDRPLLNESLESVDVPGLFLAGDLTGLSLIRNAIEQGAHVAHTIAGGNRVHGAKGRESYDLVVVGTGPAGLSAILEASRLGLKAIALEQCSVAQSIRSFPRHKLVLDQGDSAAGQASLWLEQCTKEKLVSKWTQVARRARLPIIEGHRMTRVDRATDDVEARFKVWANSGQSEEVMFATSHLLLALGKRGSPRKLPVPIPESFESDVHYALVDARPFAGRQVLVVGLGDTAMEAALALAGQSECRVTVVARASGLTKGKAKNIQALEHLVNQGRVALHFGASIATVGDHEVRLDIRGTERQLAVDSMFVLIGAEPPWPLLEGLGVRRGGMGETNQDKRANTSEACPEPEPDPR